MGNSNLFKCHVVGHICKDLKKAGSGLIMGDVVRGNQAIVVVSNVQQEGLNNSISGLGVSTQQLVGGQQICVDVHYAVSLGSLDAV